jgi:hypothetical protein
MNRRRNEVRPSASIYFALILSAIIMAGGGVLHAFYKNRQVTLTREIDAIDHRVEQYRLDIRTTDMRMDLLLNRFAIRKQLEDNGSSLRSIPMGAVEEIQPPGNSRHNVASIAP